VKYYANGRKMPPCKAIEAATGKYFDDQDIIGLFISDLCTLDKAARIPKTEIYGKFEGYCRDEHGIKRPMRPKTFMEALEKRGIYESRQHYNGKTTRVFMGVNFVEIDGFDKNSQNPGYSPISPSYRDQLEFDESLSNSSTTTSSGAPETTAAADEKYVDAMRVALSKGLRGAEADQYAERILAGQEQPKEAGEIF
jgi:phage/plasmid-associated DNA primase